MYYTNASFIANILDCHGGEKEPRNDETLSSFNIDAESAVDDYPENRTLDTDFRRYGTAGIFMVRGAG